MKLALVSATFPPYRGGTGNVVYHNARVLHNRGHQVTVLTGRTSSFIEAVPFRVEYLAAPVRVGNASFTPGLLGRLRDFDLVHLHLPNIAGGELTALACRMRRLPLVVTYHNDLFGPDVRELIFTAYSRTGQRWVLAGARGVIVTSADYANSSPALRRLPPTRILEVPNGVDTSRFRPSEMEDRSELAALGVPPNAPVALFVGAMDQAHFFKGVSVMLSALELTPNVHAVLVGDGEMRPMFENWARQPLQGRAHFAGFVPIERLVRLYQSATVTVLPSFTAGEAFGLVLLESMACGTPVVASNLPGVRTVVKDGVDGYLVPAVDVRGLAAALTAITASPEAGRHMGEAGRRKVERLYSWEIVGDRLEQAYETFMRRPTEEWQGRRPGLAPP